MTGLGIGITEPHPLSFADQEQLPRRVRRSIIVYIGPRSLTRDSISQCLSRSLRDFEVRAVVGPVDAIALAGADDGVMLVLLNVGSRSVDCPDISECVAGLLAALPNTPVAVIAESDGYEAIMAALRTGIRGYIPTSLASAVVVEAVRLICAGDTYAPLSCLLQRGRPASEVSAPASTVAAADFSPRQWQILDCLRRGMANKQIAHVLTMSEGTVKVHVRKIMRKLGATNRTQVVMRTLALFPNA